MAAMNQPARTPAIHIFKPGRHVTMAGEAIEFSETDLAATARAYDPKRHEAPLVIGHPATDDPAQGWVASLVANERGLFAAPRDLEPAFAESVRARRYGKVSAKFYRPDDANNPTPGVWALRHVGFLGAQPPGVKGLDDPAFAASDDGCVMFQEAVEFGDWTDRNVAGLFRSLRDWLLAKFGQDEADRALPGWGVDSAQESAAQPESDTAAPAFSEESSVNPQEKAALEAENQKLKQQLAERDARDKAVVAAKRHEGNAAFAEGLVGKGVLAPANKDVVVAMLDTVSAPGGDGKAVEFGEGDDKQPLAEALRKMLAGAPPVVEFGETATKDRAGTQTNINPLVANAEARAAGK